MSGTDEHMTMSEATWAARGRVLDDIAKLDETYRERGDIFAGAFLKSLLTRYKYEGPRPVQPEGERYP